MPVSAKSGYPGFEKGLFFSPEKQMKSPCCPHYTPWVTFNLKTWTHKPVIRGHPLSSSINSGIFCEITSLRLNAMQMRGLKAENTALSRPPVSPSAITPQFSPPREMNPAQRITHSVIFSAWSHRFFPIAEVSAEKKKNVWVYLRHVVELLHQRCKQKKINKKRSWLQGRIIWIARLS